MRAAVFFELLLLCGGAFAQETAPLVGTSPAPVVQKKRRKVAKKPAPNILAGDKFTLDELKTLVASVHKGRLKEQQLLEAMETRGVGFAATETNMDVLTRAGASDPVVQAAVRLGGPLTPPPAPKRADPTYSLTVTCQPPPCAARIGEMPFRDAPDGKLTFSGLRPGRLIVDAQREGFETRTDVVKLDPAVVPNGEGFAHTISLQPTEATRNKWGSELLAAALARAAWKDAAGVITGTLTISDPEPTDWKVTAQIGGNSASNLLLENSSGKVQYMSVGGMWQSKVFRKPFRGSNGEKALAEAALLRNVETWLTSEYGSVMRQIAVPHAVASSSSDPSATGQPKTLEIKTVSSAYVIQLNDELRPVSLRFLQADVTYAEFGKLESGAIYPRRTEVRFADREKHTAVFAAKDWKAK